MLKLLFRMLIPLVARVRISGQQIAMHNIIDKGEISRLPAIAKHRRLTPGKHRCDE